MGADRFILSGKMPVNAMARILVMDDDIELSFKICNALKHEGYDTYWCRDATEAFDTLMTAKIPFDLVITDIFILVDGEIASDGGYRLISMLRSAEATGRINKTLVIAISGVTDSEGNPYALQTAETIGADYTLTKPVDDATLISCVNSALVTGPVA